MAFLIGVDVGSQSVKACVLDDEGRRRALHDAPCSLHHPASGWAEQDPQDWTGALAAAVRGACEQAGVTARDTVTLGLACQVDGVVAARRASPGAAPGHHLDGPAGRPRDGRARRRRRR